MSHRFTQVGWDDYTSWQSKDRKTLKKINKLIASIKRDGLLKGEGKPERLKHLNMYSRRIDENNRLCYRKDDDLLVVLSCKGHYE